MWRKLISGVGITLPVYLKATGSTCSTSQGNRNRGGTRCGVNSADYIVILVLIASAGCVMSRRIDSTLPGADAPLDADRAKHSAMPYSHVAKVPSAAKAPERVRQASR
jgi:hypothetical protein